VIKHFFTRQFLGFLGVGASAAFINWSSRILFSLWMPFYIAIAFAYAIGMTVAFTLNSFFVFPNSARSRHQQASHFVFINLAFFPVVWIASILFNKALRWAGMVHGSEALSHGAALALPMAATFLFYKFIAFKEEGQTVMGSSKSG
jgi:putative flippase GtrA